MGMASRTYGMQPRRTWGEWMTPAILWLLVANTIVFFNEILALWSSPQLYVQILHWLGLMPEGVFPGLRVWQPLTYLFLHDATGVGHYFWNMLSLWMFGRDLERAWGTKKFLTFYLVVGASAGLLNVIALAIAGKILVTTIGASGAIFGILMASAMLWPDRRVGLILPPVVMPMRWFVFMWGLLAFFGTLIPSGGNTSHFTHLSGMAVAYIYLRRGSFLYRLRNRYYDWKRQRARRKFEVYMRDHKEEPPSGSDRWVN